MTPQAGRENDHAGERDGDRFPDLLHERGPSSSCGGRSVIAPFPKVVGAG